jgi:glycerophosphoryl diester phosphodiesterase
MDSTPSITIGSKTAQLTCHRAVLSGGLRPNSAAAVRECLEARVARLEIDVHSLDGADYIVSHERRLERETTGSGSIGNATPDDVRALRFLDDRDERPALLSEIVELARGSVTQLQLDLKDWRPLRVARLKVLFDVIAPVKDGVIVTAGEDWNLRLLHGADPHLAIGFDPGRYFGAKDDEPTFLPRAVGAYGYLDDHPMAVGRTEEPSDYLRARMEILELQCPAAREMFLDYRLILQMLDDGFDAVAWLHGRGREVTAWTVDHTGVDTVRAVERLVGAGVDRITTNTPREWVALFESAEVATERREA